MKRLIAGFLLLTAMLLPQPSWAGKAHEHGAVKLDLAVDGQRIMLQMESPLDNLLGFERAPRSDAERKSVDAMVSRLKAAETLFKPDPAAQCSLGTVSLQSPTLKLGSPDPDAKDDGHADLDATFEFNCKDATQAAFVDVALFDAFPRMKRIQVQAATAKGQFKRTLAAPARRVDFSR